VDSEQGTERVALVQILIGRRLPGRGCVCRFRVGGLIAPPDPLLSASCKTPDMSHDFPPEEWPAKQRENAVWNKTLDAWSLLAVGRLGCDAPCH